MVAGGLGFTLYFYYFYVVHFISIITTLGSHKEYATRCHACAVYSKVPAPMRS